jgi:transposase
LDAIIERCCGLDVHRDTVVACVLVGPLDQKPRKQIRTFSTMAKGLSELQEWLQQEGCTHAAMESTGVYWKPVYSTLEGYLDLKLANAQRVKNVPGSKTDASDAEWIAKLLRAGLIAGSFIPNKDIRELRELTRYRKKLLSNATAEKNRILKVLESAGIKLASVIADVFGVTGRALLEQLMTQGQFDKEMVQSIAKGQIRQKVPLIMEASSAQLSVKERFLIRQSWNHLMFLEQSISELDAQISEILEPYREDVERVQSIPGMDKKSVAAVVGEIGIDMGRFVSEHHLASWAGLSPGNNESAGKKLFSNRPGKSSY